MTPDNAEGKPLSKSRNNDLGQEFILEEYRQCYEHMRHYDNSRASLAKFAFSLYTGVATVFLGIEHIFPGIIRSSPQYFAMFLGFIFLLSVPMDVMLLRSRRAFVRVAKQVASIRELLLGKTDPGLQFDNFLTRDTQFPFAFDKTHRMLILMAGLRNSALLGLAGLLLSQKIRPGPGLWLWKLAVLLVVIIAWGCHFYLARRTLKSEDQRRPSWERRSGDAG